MKENQKLKIEYVGIDEIKPYKNNAKKHPPEQIEQIKKSIEKFGMDDPIGIWKDEIVEGHGRLIACKELGFTEIPIIRLDHLTDEERKAYTLAHNQLTMNSDFDIDILNEELFSFENIDMSDFGFEMDTKISEKEIVEDDYEIEIPKQPKAKVGDIYQLGNHRLMCGDNGIFKGVPLTNNEKHISALARELYKYYPNDGKYILTDNKFICCQSNASNEELKERLDGVAKEVIINPLGEWTGGTNVDTGATNRKLGSDMAQSLTGGGLHGKDLSKADVSVNIYAFLKAQETEKEVNLCCAIGDTEIDGKPYSEIVEIAKEYINSVGGFEKFAEWGLF